MSAPSGAVREHLLATLGDHERLLGITERILRDHPELNSAGFGPDEIAQLIHGFAGLVREELEGGARETRNFFLETAIPVAMSQGQTVPDLARSVTAFAVSISDVLGASLADDERRATNAWLARFFGDYARDAIAAAVAATEGS